MMKQPDIGTVEPATQLGDFTIFGYTRDPKELLEHRLPTRLGITPRTIDFGTAGRFFFYTSYGDVAESEEAIALKLGFLRSPTKSPLSAEQLLTHRMVGPGFVNNSAFRGNALVACFSKSEPIFSAFATLIAVPQLYYSVSDTGIVCSDRFRCIVDTMDRVELNEDTLPMHFLFRFPPGALTYLRNVQCMLPGQLLKWRDGELSARLVQDLHFAYEDRVFTRANANSLDTLYESLRDVIGDYVTQIEMSGRGVATFLSGGVDSSLIQFLITESPSRLPARSISYAIRVPDFEFEIQYAKQASQLFHTDHTLVDVYPEDLPGLLIKYTDILAQPVTHEVGAAMLAIAEFAQEADFPARFFASGQAADGLFGLGSAKKLKGLNYVRRIPAAASALKGLGTLLKPIPAPSRILLTGAEILDSANDPHSYISPSNAIAVRGADTFELVRRCFGDQAVRTALEYRRDLAAQYLETDHYLEKPYIVDLVTDGNLSNVRNHQLLLAHRREGICPFLDEDILRAGFAFHPDIRYIKGFRSKYLLKEILEQKTGSAVTRRPKGGSRFGNDVFAWMRHGPLRPLVQDIQLPGFLSRADYEQLLERPDFFLWLLLALDIFQKRVLKG